MSYFLKSVLNISRGRTRPLPTKESCDLDHKQEWWLSSWWQPSAWWFVLCECERSLTVTTTASRTRITKIVHVVSFTLLRGLVSREIGKVSRLAIVWIVSVMMFAGCPNIIVSISLKMATMISSIQLFVWAVVVKRVFILAVSCSLSVTSFSQLASLHSCFFIASYRNCSWVGWSVVRQNWKKSMTLLTNICWNYYCCWTNMFQFSVEKELMEMRACSFSSIWSSKSALKSSQSCMRVLKWALKSRSLYSASWGHYKGRHKWHLWQQQRFLKKGIFVNHHNGNKNTIVSSDVVAHLVVVVAKASLSTIRGEGSTEAKSVCPSKPFYCPNTFM